MSVMFTLMRRSDRALKVVAVTVPVTFGPPENVDSDVTFNDPPSTVAPDPTVRVDVPVILTAPVILIAVLVKLVVPLIALIA